MKKQHDDIVLYMPDEYADLYRQFLLDIDTSKQAGLTENERIEQCFWKAKTFWELLKVNIKTKGFESDESEIGFFRNVKPAFTCYVEYFVLLSEAMHFVPVPSMTHPKETVITYWKEEFNRCTRCFEKNKQFIDYYLSDNREHDHIYFLRRNNTNEISEAVLAPVHEGGNEFCTYGDPLVRCYLAYKMYQAYVVKQLEALQTSETA